jgi:hypothetical protein
MDMTKRELLHVEKNKKFDEICALLARELGYSELGTMSAAMRGYVEREAEYHVKQWEETVEMRTPAYMRPITPLTRLLNQYNDICERILDEHDIEIGLWAYKKGLQRRKPASLRH